jgi:hypothetical protein
MQVFFCVGKISLEGYVETHTKHRRLGDLHGYQGNTV